MAVKPIRDGYHTVTPYITVRGGAEALAFYAEAFGATELSRMEYDGRIGHAEIQIGDSRVMLSDELPEWGNVGPQTLGGSPCGLCLSVEDVDAVFAKAVAAGATVKKPLADQFYGDRSGTVTDPFGHVWTISTHIEDVSDEEMRVRMDKLMGTACAEPQPA